MDKKKTGYYINGGIVCEEPTYYYMKMSGSMLNGRSEGIGHTGGTTRYEVINKTGQELIDFEYYDFILEDGKAIIE